jgi:hypothetical protein
MLGNIFTIKCIDYELWSQKLSERRAVSQERKAKKRVSMFNPDKTKLRL